MTEKKDALNQIVVIAQSNGISAREIELAMNPASTERSGMGIVMKIFSILGGIFIFSGISTYIGMFWGEMNSPMRVIITLGSGFAAYIMGIVFSRDPRRLYTVAPILLVAAILECGGLFVLIYEYFNNHTNNWQLACRVVFGIMLLQQGLTFISLRIPVLLFTTLWFASFFFAMIFDMLGVRENWNAIIIGISLLLIAYGLRDSAYQRTLQIAYLAGSLLVLCASFDLLRNTPFEILYLALTCFMIYMSVVARSSSLLIISVLAMLSYIGYFTAEHFVRSAGWPLAMIILGVLFFVIGAGAIRIKKRYIS
jgi:uncharacterized membrane protein